VTGGGAAGDDGRLAATKRALSATVADRATGLVELSRRIHAHPELSFEEELASTWCAEALEAGGFDVDKVVCDLPTAFSATAGTGPLVVAICCEYDALPEVGHACGHNVIAAAAVGAGLALARAADDLGITVRVLGTPAEEGGGGKILMLERGGFDGLHAAMMVHPWPSELVQMPCLAVSHFDVAYTGRASHASAFPERGINAADAITVAQVAIGLLRQHCDAGDQVHGIVTLGGAAPNIVPEHTRAKYYVRSSTLAGLDTWQPRVHRCFEAGAIATGASVEIIPQGPVYSEFVTDEAMASLYQANAEALGRRFATPSGKVVAASTDMANVSLALPSIHPTLGLDSLPAVNHQADFAAHCVTPIADTAVVDGATAMAWTVADLASDPRQRDRLAATSYRSVEAEGRGGASAPS
jgi:amidohydrolase